MLARSRTALRRSPQCADTRIGSERIRVTVAMISQQVDRGGEKLDLERGISGGATRPVPVQLQLRTGMALRHDRIARRARAGSAALHHPPCTTEAARSNRGRSNSHAKLSQLDHDPVVRSPCVSRFFSHY